MASGYCEFCSRFKDQEPSLLARLSSSGGVCVLTQRWTLQGHSRWLFVLMTVIGRTNHGFQTVHRNGIGPSARISNVVDRFIRVSMIEGRASDFTESAYYSRGVLPCEGQPNLGIRESIRNRAHGYLGDDSFCCRCWDNRDAHAGIDERYECRHLSCCLDHLRDDSSVQESASFPFLRRR